MLAKRTSSRGIEDLGGAVAVVDVPVEDQHLLDPALRERVRDPDRDVVEQAEAHRPPRFGVVAGRAQPAEREAVLAGEQPLRRARGGAGPAQRRLPGGFADERVGVEGAAAGRAEALRSGRRARTRGRGSARGARLAAPRRPTGPASRRRRAGARSRGSARRSRDAGRCRDRTTRGGGSRGPCRRGYGSGADEPRRPKTARSPASTSRSSAAARPGSTSPSTPPMRERGSP